MCQWGLRGPIVSMPTSSRKPPQKAVLCVVPSPTRVSPSSPSRQHHRLGHLHLTQGCPGALGLCGPGPLCLGPGRRRDCSWLSVLCRAGSGHPQVWRGLCLCHGDLRGPGWVSMDLPEWRNRRYRSKIDLVLEVPSFSFPSLEVNDRGGHREGSGYCHFSRPV